MFQVKKWYNSASVLTTFIDLTFYREGWIIVSFLLCNLKQWRNRRGGAGGKVPPRDFWPGNFCWRIWKKEARKKWKRGENWEEKKENYKREGGKKKRKWKWEKLWKEKRGEDIFFFFSHLKTTEICFGNQSTFPVSFNREFSTGKKSGKAALPPQKNMPITPLTTDILKSMCEYRKDRLSLKTQSLLL